MWSFRETATSASCHSTEPDKCELACSRSFAPWKIVIDDRSPGKKAPAPPPAHFLPGWTAPVNNTSIRALFGCYVLFVNKTLKAERQKQIPKSSGSSQSAMRGARNPTSSPASRVPPVTINKKTSHLFFCCPSAVPFLTEWPTPLFVTVLQAPCQSSRKAASPHEYIPLRAEKSAPCFVSPLTLRIGCAVALSARADPTLLPNPLSKITSTFSQPGKVFSLSRFALLPSYRS